MAAIETLETDRLIARRMCGSDFDELCRMYQDARVMATLGGVRTVQEIRELIQAGLAHWDRFGFGFWVLRDPATGGFVGRAGLRHVEIDGVDEVELAYALHAEYWHRGLATEIAQSILLTAFESLGLTNLVAFTLPANRASRRVMEKVGFRYERDIIHADQPHVLYRMAGAPWRHRRRVTRAAPGES